MIWPASPSSVTTANPDADHACMPPPRFTASYPRWRRAAAARSERPPERHTATTGLSWSSSFARAASDASGTWLASGGVARLPFVGLTDVEQEGPVVDPA